MAINSNMQQQAENKSSWADLTDDEYEYEDFNPLPPAYTIEPDKNGIKTTISYKYNEEGKQVKVTTRTKVKNLRLSKHAAERRSWAKFGDAGREDASSKLTVVSTEEIFLVRPGMQQEGKKSEGQQPDPTKKEGTLSCRICNGAHWTARCPYQDVAPNSNGDTLIPDNKPGGGKYVPPRSRAGSSFHRDEENSLKVSNLPEDAEEDDLRDLFGFCGPLGRVYVVKDRVTGMSRGFAFVNFVHKEDAQRAIGKLNRHAYGNLILEVDWAAPRQPK